MVGLAVERAELHRRIDARVAGMVRDGWVGEVEDLLRRGYSPELPSLSSLGYGELVRHVRGDLSLEAAVEKIGVRTRGLARHQRNWFKPSDRRIRWFEASPAGHAAAVAWVADEVDGDGKT
jgi:tRNA dimethylallyltransferase